ncbi:efflux RND transporter periplasmic adaptor subunit [Gymnodinialimonas sp. 2305UL16-5]|uniref:efflux RND transporter periplasmic adaptor subunit n=1 Tax=Gymnodinialimonas mytili TaxID=3126503 RepID=UPI0030963A16
MVSFGRAVLVLVLGIGASIPVAAQEAPPRPAILMDVSSDEVGVTRQFFGHVVARQTVDLAFQVGGQIVEFPAPEGEVIPAGDLVARLDLEPFELQVQQAQLQLEQAERALTRLQQLTVSVTEVQLQDAETDVALASVALRNAEVALDNATLMAPFDALVASRNVANFSTVNQGTPVVRLHDMSELRIEIDVPEVLFQRAGEDADIRLEARFPTSDQTYPLETREFNAEASSVGQSFRLTLALPSDNGVAALPGSSVIVFATLFEGDAPMLIPATALRIANDGAASVLRFVPGTDNTGTVEEVPVSVSPTRDGRIEVTEGLRPGDEIVRTGAHAIDDGQTVRRFEGFSN